jgi:hypothetical protein
VGVALRAVRCGLGDRGLGSVVPSLSYGRAVAAVTLPVVTALPRRRSVFAFAFFSLLITNVGRMWPAGYSLDVIDDSGSDKEELHVKAVIVSAALRPLQARTSSSHSQCH